MIETRKRTGDRISQGDIYRDIAYVEELREERDKLVISRVTFPLVIILTQDCDLEQESKVLYFEQDDTDSSNSEAHRAAELSGEAALSSASAASSPYGDVRESRARYEAKDITQDKWLLSVLAAPLYNAEHVFAGDHLSELNLKMQNIPKNKTSGKFIRRNEVPRYHYLEFPPDVRIVPSIIDFKHYFTLNLHHLKKIAKESFVCQVGQLYREHISQRFAAFLSRIGLPNK